jgi:hypothetical protein
MHYDRFANVTLIFCPSKSLLCNASRAVDDDASSVYSTKAIVARPGIVRTSNKFGYLRKRSVSGKDRL